MQRITPQFVMIVQVLVAQNQAIDPLANEAVHAVFDEALVSSINKPFRELSQKATARFTLNQETIMRRREGRLNLKEVQITEKGTTYSTWRIDGYGLDGKRVRFASQDKQAALLQLRVLQTNVHNAEVKNPYRVVNTKLSDEQLRDAETAFALLGDRGIALVEAVKAALDGDAFSARLNPMPFADAVKAYLLDIKDRVRPRTLRTRRQTLGWLEDFAQSPLLSSITVEMVKKFLATKRAQNGIDPATLKTRKNIRADLGAFFNWAIDQKWLSINPAYKGSRPPKIDRGTIDILPLAKCQELMAHVDDQTARYFALALFAGIRPEEIG